MIKPLLFLAGIAFALSACSTMSWDLGGDKSAAEVGAAKDSSASKVLVKASTPDEIELQMARLSSRINDLELELNRQKERSKLIEKGLLLGLMPNELKADSAFAGQSAPKGYSGESEEKQKLSAVKLLEVKAPKEPSQEVSRDREQYKKMIQLAQEKFSRAEYGQAITAFNEISTKFDDSLTEGSQHYWVGLSWFYLKEFKLAEESFQTLLSRYPSSPWASHTNYYLAKVDQSRGLPQKALERFQKLLDENPSRDLAEMAQSEIERMKDKL